METSVIAEIAQGLSRGRPNLLSNESYLPSETGEMVVQVSLGRIFH
jgi:hypothetical protein